ncbi:MAG: NUDIX hydrolase [Ruminococcus sp.]|nr:NUDIX hydrolase [Ruminococcus sp.]
MNSEKDFLKSYSIEKYDRPSVATDIAAFTMRIEEDNSFRKDPVSKLSLLLIERGEHPYKGKWALPGGFIRMDETVVEGAVREIVEETSVKPDGLLYTGVFSKVDRDPRGRIISNAFTSVFSTQPKVLAGSDASSAKWFDVDLKYIKDDKYLLSLQSDEIVLTTELHLSVSDLGINEVKAENDVLAFDHAEIIFSSLQLLKNRALRFESIFDFLPEKFTLTSLQKVYETLTLSTAVPANFRRKVNEYVEETDEYTKGAGHRPAKLFRKKSNKI